VRATLMHLGGSDSLQFTGGERSRCPAPLNAAGDWGAGSRESNLGHRPCVLARSVALFTGMGIRPWPHGPWRADGRGLG
jgi:hypothetical protein